MSDYLNRRDFLKSGAIIALGMAAPPWLARIAKADMLRLAAGGKVDPDNTLVVCQLTGGNDGLNTLIPWADANYYRLRPTLAIPEASVLKLNDRLGLHPGMSGLQELLKAGKAAIVQNVGYPNPNRSHFRSMEIWQTANPDRREQYGWLGKYLDHQVQKGSSNPVIALELSRSKSAAFNARQASVPCFASVADVKSLIGDPDSERLLREVQGMDAPAGTGTSAVQKATKSALDAMSELNKSLGTYTSKFVYGSDQFGQGFKQIAQLIATSPKTRVVYLSGGGFDTHSRQSTQHEVLLKGFSSGLKTFMDEMQSIGKSDKVTILVFSEFGRRVAENASSGTDHGAAAPMFVVGGQVKGGIVGPNPDLADLERGDLKWHVDFRQVYSTVLDRWMGADSATIFARKFDHVDIFQSAERREGPGRAATPGLLTRTAL
ncbi:MAG: DUF1501 domain-containing protein [Fimbriimonadales bacterium]